ncbi:hypothetical protein [Streptomyces sp. NBC_00557]|uniref:hypothetical protein n=1 Tax=Streptomyces sp. NBC_00557 TaxID=2975776 RepID=UPI002E80E207|nr:hypothetical protein [Streptomyces sp. NBC_00557]WUC39385.1 hypothetical protein OG956_36850 [Streptomyces sp. NBC_00557]
MEDGAARIPDRAERDAGLVNDLLRKLSGICGLSVDKGPVEAIRVVLVGDMAALRCFPKLGVEISALGVEEPQDAVVLPGIGGSVEILQCLSDTIFAVGKGGSRNARVCQSSGSRPTVEAIRLHEAASALTA